MEVDTGASLSVISEELFNSLFSAGQAPQLVESGIVLCTYTGEEVKPKGSCSVFLLCACSDGVEYSLPLLVVGGKGLPLLGRNWLDKTKLNWSVIKQRSSHNKRLEEILQKTCSAVRGGAWNYTRGKGQNPC